MALVLGRRIGETVVIGGLIKVHVLSIDRGTVRLAIDAPPEVPIHRQEVQEAIEREKQDGN